MTYTKGKIITGTGNGWSERYFGNKWKFIKAYSVKSGQVIWECDLSGYGFRAIYNVPYFNGYLYAETQDTYGFTSKLFRIKAIDGTIESYLDYGRPITSCAPSIIAYGKMFSGDGLQDKIVVTRLCEKSVANWEGPFGCPQKNHNALPDEEDVKIVPMEEIIID